MYNLLPIEELYAFSTASTPCLSSGPDKSRTITIFYEKPRFSRRLLKANVRCKTITVVMTFLLHGIQYSIQKRNMIHTIVHPCLKGRHLVR